MKIKPLKHIDANLIFSKCFGKIYLPTLMYIPNAVITMLYMPFMDQRVADIYASIMLMVVWFMYFE